MVKVPSLSGLTRTTATQSITDSGLVAVETGSTTTTDDTLNQKIASQTPELDTLVDYETNVSYTYYLFSFTPYSFTPTAPYSFTPQTYSFTPQTYSFTPVVAGPTLPVPTLSVSVGPGAGGTAYANVTVGNIDYANSYTSTMGSQNPEFPEEWNIEGLSYGQSYTVSITASRSGYTSSTGSITFTPAAVPYSFTPQTYSFTPQTYSFTPTAGSGVWYTYCGNPSAGYDPGTVIGPLFEATKTCAQLLQVINASNDAVSGTWDCEPGTSGQPSVTAASCGTPYSFTPTAAYSFTPVAPYSFTPYSFTPVAPPYSFTPTAASGVWYAYCASSGAGGGSQGPFFWANRTCSQVQQSLVQTGEFGSNFRCGTGTEAGPSPITAPTCSAPYSFTPVAPYSFTPYSFTPVYSFTPYSFTPVYSFTPYSFTPQAYSFTPVAYSFTPVAPYSFTPQAYSFVPLKVCIDQDTLVQVVGLEDSVEFKAAKDIKLGDKIWSITWEGLLDDLQDPSASTVYPENLQGVQRVKSEIVQIEPSIKETTIYFNGDKNKRFTAEEKVLIKRGSSHIFVEAKTITTADFIFEATDSGMIATPVTGIDYIEETRNVFKFNAFPVDTIIAGNMVVHNSKL
jgi:hypothetical protein